MYDHHNGGSGYSASAFHFRPAPSDAAPEVTVAVLSNTENTEEAEMMMLALAETLTDRRNKKNAPDELVLRVGRKPAQVWIHQR